MKMIATVKGMGEMGWGLWITENLIIVHHRIECAGCSDPVVHSTPERVLRRIVIGSGKRRARKRPGKGRKRRSDYADSPA